MARLIVNVVIAFLFGIATVRYQHRQGVHVSFWHALVYAALFNVGVNLLETSLGVLE
jgi:hypothetical protein